jgi:hypothetical protein
MARMILRAINKLYNDRAWNRTAGLLTLAEGLKEEAENINDESARQKGLQLEQPIVTVQSLMQLSEKGVGVDIMRD